MDRRDEHLTPWLGVSSGSNHTHLRLGLSVQGQGTGKGGLGEGERRIGAQEDKALAWAGLPRLRSGSTEMLPDEAPEMGLSEGEMKQSVAPLPQNKGKTECNCQSNHLRI